MSAALLKALGAAMLCVALAAVMKRIGSPFATALVYAGVVSLIMFALPRVKEIADAALGFANASPVSEYFPLIFKICAAAFIAEAASDVASSAGDPDLSKAISFAGRCEIVALSLPLIKELANCAMSMAGA